jgi:ABC-type phosphate/phosphonate transport system ATPase subunit
MLSLNLHPVNTVNQHCKRVHVLRKQYHTIIEGLTKTKATILKD